MTPQHSCFRSNFNCSSSTPFLDGSEMDRGKQRSDPNGLAPKTRACPREHDFHLHAHTLMTFLLIVSFCVVVALASSNISGRAPIFLSGQSGRNESSTPKRSLLLIAENYARSNFLYISDAFKMILAIELVVVVGG